MDYEIVVAKEAGEENYFTESDLSKKDESDNENSYLLLAILLPILGVIIVAGLVYIFYKKN